MPKFNVKNLPWIDHSSAPVIVVNEIREGKPTVTSINGERIVPTMSLQERIDMIAKKHQERIRMQKEREMNESVIIESNRDDCPGMLMHDVMAKLEKIGVKSEILYESEDSMEVKFSIKEENEA